MEPTEYLDHLSPSGGDSPPRPPGRLLELYSPSVWRAELVFTPWRSCHCFPQGFQGAPERFIFLCLANSPSPPRNQESQKLMPRGLRFLSWGRKQGAATANASRAWKSSQPGGGMGGGNPGLDQFSFLFPEREGRGRGTGNTLRMHPEHWSRLFLSLKGLVLSHLVSLSLSHLVSLGGSSIGWRWAHAGLCKEQQRHPH